jgi:hypothetical protein
MSIKKEKMKKRCAKKGCRKKLPLIQLPCRCKKLFCSRHWQRHDCTADVSIHHQAKLALENPSVKFKKIDKI